MREQVCILTHNDVGGYCFTAQVNEGAVTVQHVSSQVIFHLDVLIPSHASVTYLLFTQQIKDYTPLHRVRCDFTPACLPWIVYMILSACGGPQLRIGYDYLLVQLKFVCFTT